MNGVFFMADGGGAIGMGHVVRCLSLADAFRQAGWAVTFVSSLEQGIDRIKTSGYSVHRIDPFDETLPEEAKVKLEALLAAEAAVLVIDSYRPKLQDFRRYGKCVSVLAYVDDLNREQFPVDVVINGNVSAHTLGYRALGERPALLLGPAYNMIRSAFRGLPPKIVSEQVSKVLVTTGGADPLGHCLSMTAAMAADWRNQALEIHVVVGGAFQNPEAFETLAAQYVNLRLHRNVTAMEELMQTMDLAVSAGGSTLYELCACGVPTLTYAMVDNQEAIVRVLAEMGCVADFGAYEPFHPEAFLNRLQDLIHDHALRENLSAAGRSVVDGYGTQRIVERITSMLQ